MSKKGKVLVAMSGGVDSAVTALMLHNQGYELIGLTMKTWDYSSSGGSRKETGCCSLDSINDARDLAVKIGFPHYILDVREEFEKYIISDFVNEYLEGRTPNPCVLCNIHIKWDALLKRADQLGCDYLATGHYAKVNNMNNRYFVSKGKDSFKDQSYVLWGISQENLARTIMPLGEFEKTEIKEMAKRSGFDTLAKKSESYEICFVPDNDYRNFLKRKVDGLSDKVSGGNFVLKSGEIIGKHEGYPFYTIGQRRGLDIALGYPAYVIDIDGKSNTITVGEKEDLYKRNMKVSNLNMMKYPHEDSTYKIKTKIRHRSSEIDSTLTIKDNTADVKFDNSISAITPGQSAVFYEHDDVIGGGIIDSVE